METRLHADFTSAVAEAVGWPGSVKRLAKEAMTPDLVRVVNIGPFGAHLFGLNTASLCHFNKRMKVDGNLVNRGYRWSADESIPIIKNLPDVETYSRPEEWLMGSDYTPTIPGPLLKKEPLFVLLAWLRGEDTKSKKRRGDTSADEITWVTASDYTVWFEKLLRSAKNGDDFDTFLGWIAHMIEDMSVPHHVYNVLLNGHSSFEAMMTELFFKSRVNMANGDTTGQKAISAFLTITENAEIASSARYVCEATADLTTKLFDSHGRLKNTKVDDVPELVALDVAAEAVASLLKKFAPMRAKLVV